MSTLKQRTGHKSKSAMPLSAVVVVLTAFGIVFIQWVVFQSASFAQPVAVPPTLPAKLANSQPASPACTMQATLVLAEYQVWHGLPSHKETPPYLSTDPNVIANHIRSAQEQCIDGFVVDWYGPARGLASDADRQFEDSATAEVLRQAATKDFKVALMYDEGTLRNLPAPDGYTTQVISDLLYARQYFTLTSYLKLNEQPALFVFPYEAIDAQIDWQTVRQQLGVTITLLDKDPDPNATAHDAQFDGFYTWVQASTPQWLPNDWGEEYLKWFYKTMTASSYANKIAIGGAWPGFNDKTMARTADRYMARRCGQTWLDTWNLAKVYHPAIVMIGTWNDFSEESDIENGIIKIVATNNGPTLANQPTAFNATMSDCNGVTYTWDFGDGMVGIGADEAHVYTTTGVYTAVVTAALPTTTLTTTTVVQVKSDVIAWQENFNPLAPARWQQVSAQWSDPPGPTAKLCEANPNDLSGKVESERIDVNVDRYPFLRVATTAVDSQAHYTVQILDKTTNVATDVLRDVATSRSDEVNLAEQLHWTGAQTFTINLWIIGEGKCAVFDGVSIEKSYTPTSTVPLMRLFFPIIGK